MAAGEPDYRLGAIYGTVTALALSTQEPFSYLAAKRLSPETYVLFTQAALLVSVPLLLAKAQSRRDFVAILGNPAMYGKIAVILAMGITGLVLYKYGLTGAHPIIIAAILNLSPFWAAIIAKAIGGVHLPVSTLTFSGCLIAAFLGAMAVTWSQVGAGSNADLLKNLFKGSWIFAVPIPILSALNGALIAKWFGDYRESAAIAVNFIVPAAILIPVTGYLSVNHGGFGDVTALPIVLLLIGTIIASSFGRLGYQIALTAVNADNGFVTMFFLLVPAVTALISLPMSMLIPELKLYLNASFYIGLILIAGALGLFTFVSWRREPTPSAAVEPAT